MSPIREFSSNHKTSRRGWNVWNLRQAETWCPLSGDTSADELNVGCWDEGRFVREWPLERKRRFQAT
jgi:hypothetical protein